MKLIDLVEYKTALIMFTASNRLLPGNIQKMFSEREGGYNLRRELNLKVHFAGSTLKKMCISVCGVSLWNGLSKEAQQSPNLIHFKKVYKKIIFKRYLDEEGLG